MRLKYNNAFSLLEVVLTVAILTTGIVFLFRSFASVLSSVRFSQDISLACYLAEAKLWDAEQKAQGNPAVSESGKETIQGKDFSWDYKAEKLEARDIEELDFNVTWNENLRRKESYAVNTYLVTKKP